MLEISSNKKLDERLQNTREIEHRKQKIKTLAVNNSIIIKPKNNNTESREVRVEVQMKYFLIFSTEVSIWILDSLLISFYYIFIHHITIKWKY